MRQAKTKQEQIDLGSLLIALDRIKETKPSLESIASEAEECAKQGLIRNYSITLTRTSLEIDMWIGSFSRLVAWDKAPNGVLTLREGGENEKVHKN